MADVAILAAAFFLAYLPAINIQVRDFYSQAAITQVSFVVFIQISSLFVFGAYSIIWRYISLRDIKHFLGAAALSSAILISLRFALADTAFSLWQVPISVIIIDAILGFGGLLAIRVSRRFVYEFQERNRTWTIKKRLKPASALLIGAGRTGATLAREIAGRSDSHLSIKGFVDDDPRKKGGSVSGIKVLGGISSLARLIDDLNIEQVVITPDEYKGKEIRHIMDLCADLSVKARIVPSLSELSGGKLTISRIRDVQIEDILGRDPVLLDSNNLEDFLTGKVVMVTGAGGSIGSELIRQILGFKPSRIVLVERSEFHLFEITRELSAEDTGTEIVSLIADICDEPRMRAVFEEHRPAVVYHAAAHKHVPLMETNVLEALKNNVFATLTVGRLAADHGASNFVLISTDKAVNPTSIMGASKRMAELVVQGLDRETSTNFVAVRFGNVLGSAGSVVPIFREQIRKGGPVTVTDPEMTRYFMTIPEASQLVLQAAALGKGGEIFVLDMGEPVKVLELAEDMIRLSGLTPYEDIDIVFSGIRKGEKLFEELEITGEGLERTLHPKIFIGKIARYSNDDVTKMLAAFRNAVEQQNEALIRRLFNQFFEEASVAEIKEAANEKAAVAKGKYFTQASRLGMAE